MQHTAQPTIPSIVPQPFFPADVDPAMPVLVAYGAGVDSTAMLIGMRRIG